MSFKLLGDSLYCDGNTYREMQPTAPPQKTKESQDRTKALLHMSQSKRSKMYDNYRKLGGSDSKIATIYLNWMIKKELRQMGYSYRIAEAPQVADPTHVIPETKAEQQAEIVAARERHAREEAARAAARAEAERLAETERTTSRAEAARLAAAEEAERKRLEEEKMVVITSTQPQLDVYVEEPERPRTVSPTPPTKPTFIERLRSMFKFGYQRQLPRIQRPRPSFASLAKTQQTELSKPQTKTTAIGLPKTKMRIQTIKPPTALPKTLTGLTKLFKD